MFHTNLEYSCLKITSAVTPQHKLNFIMYVALVTEYSLLVTLGHLWSRP